MADSQSSRFIPVMKEDGYLCFKKEVLLWESITKIDEKERAGNLIFKLPDKAKLVALDMDRSELADGVTRQNSQGQDVKISGVGRLLEVLDGIYLEDLNREKFKAYNDFRNFKRNKNQSLSDFLCAYDAKKRHLEGHGITLPEEIYAFELLVCCNLGREEESIANSTVGELTYEAMKAQIKKVVSNFNAHKDDGIVKVEKEEPNFYMYETYCEGDQEDQSSTYYSDGYHRFQRFPRSSNQARRGQRGRMPSRNQQRGYQRSYQRMNPKDQFGNHHTCHVCGSVNHFARQCPKSQYYAETETEKVALFQKSETPKYDQSTMEKFTSQNFCRAVLDTGCNTTVCGKDWLNVYLDSLTNEQKRTVEIEDSNVSFKFGDNSPTISSKRYKIPAVVCNKEIFVIAEVVNDTIPLLISKKSMSKAKMIIDLGDNTVTAFGYTQKLLKTESGHCSIPLQRVSMEDDVCPCTKDNLVVLQSSNSNDKRKNAIKLHKQFGHPRADQLKSLLKMAGKHDKELFSEIDKLAQSCETCLRYKIPGSKPIVCMPLATQFNDTVSMDLKVYDDKKGIYFQHMIDTFTRFSMVKVLRSKDKETIIESIFTHWISIFGRPRRFLSDNGGEYNNHHFIDLCEKLGVHVITTGAESAWSNGIVERHHALLSRNVSKIVEDTGCKLETAVAWASNSKNIFSNMGGYSPYQLVLGVNPNIPSLDDPYESPTILEKESPSKTVAEHITAIYSAREQQLAKDADEKIRRALSHKVRDVRSNNVQNGDKVYYKREESQRWKGPATVIGVDGKVVFLRHGGFQVKCHISRVVNVNEIYGNQAQKSVPGSDSPDLSTIDRITETKVSDFDEVRNMMIDTLPKPEHSSVQAKDVECPTTESHSGPDHHDETIKVQKLCEAKERYERKSVNISVQKDDFFSQEKREEIEKWIRNDVFEEISVDEIEESVVPISVGWVLTHTDKKKKARLVARGFQDEVLESTSTASPTCRKESLRTLLSLSASNGWSISSVDIAAAFLQGKELNRTVYLVPPSEYGKKHVLWRLKKCVYGLSDAAQMWYSSVKDEMIAAGIERCPHDDSFFYWKQNGVIEGTVAIHVDDFIFGGTEAFKSHVEATVLKSYDIGSRQDGSFTFLGLEISQDPDTCQISVCQQNYIMKELQVIPLSSKRKSQKNHNVTPDEFRAFKSLCGKLLWLSVQTRPDIAFDVCQLSNHLSDPAVLDIIQINKLVSKLRAEPKISLEYKSIDMETCQLFVYSDAAYGNLPRHGSQGGFIIFITDSSETVMNPIVWKSLKIERTCQSALSAEGLALVKAVDYAIFLQRTLSDMNVCTGHIPIKCFTDSKSLYEVLVRTRDPEEKKLLCILAPLRDSIERREMTIERISTKEMPADVLTKRGVNSKILRLHLENNV